MIDTVEIGEREKRRWLKHREELEKERKFESYENTNLILHHNVTVKTKAKSILTNTLFGRPHLLLSMSHIVNYT